jgi:hypothetical protein
MLFNLETYVLASYELSKVLPFYNANGIFQYGSSVYENKKPDDIDVIVVYESSSSTNTVQIKSGIYQITAYHISKFTEMLNLNKIDALECLFLPKSKYKYTTPVMDSILKSVVIDKEKLRRSIAAVSSNAFVKAKKKLQRTEDYNLQISIKSLWHSFRVMDYGIQIATHGKIIDYKSKNILYQDIIKKYIETKCNWDKIYEEYRPEMNKLHTEFKLLCPL